MALNNKNLLFLAVETISVLAGNTFEKTLYMVTSFWRPVSLVQYKYVTKSRLKNYFFFHIFGTTSI